jgi:nucleoside-diphosphate-sugar epimerase
MAHYLVTGSAGFIGSNVIGKLLAEGHHVIGIDNMNNAYDVRLKQWRASRLNGCPHFTAYCLDIFDRQALRKVFETQVATTGKGFDAVFNLAARAGVRPSVENPWLYFDTNTTGTLNLLELCREFGVAKFILSSTSSLYGKDNPMPWQEDQNTNLPLSPYAASKKAAEVLCHTYHYLYGLDVTVFRYFTVFGPAGRPDMSLFRFVQWISEGRPVVVFGDGKQSRDFTYVEDIACGTIAGLRPVGYEVINLGSDKPVVLLDAIHMIEEMVGRKAMVEFRNRHAADTPASWADNNKARQILGWKPHFDIAHGIGALVNWYQENQTWASEIATQD